MPWKFIYPFFLVHMLMFSASGFFMAYNDKPAPVGFLYMHGGIAIVVYMARVDEGLAIVANEDAAQIPIAVVKEPPAWPPNVVTAMGTRAVLGTRGAAKDRSFDVE